MTRGAIAAGVVLFGCASGVSAQTAPPRMERIVVGVGIGAAGTAPLGEVDASLRAGAGRQPPVLFRSESRLAAAPEAHLRVGVALTRRIEVESGLTASRPELRVSVSGDTEGAPSVTAVEVVEQLGIDVGLRVALRTHRPGTRTIPFGAAGVGYLRQRHEGRTLVDEGRFYQMGGGLTHWFVERPAGLVRSLGLRADGGVRLVQDDLDAGDAWRRHTVA